MRIAFYSSEKEKMQWGIRHFNRYKRRICGLAVDYYKTEKKLFEGMKDQEYDLVMISEAFDPMLFQHLGGGLHRQREDLPFIFLCGDVQKLHGNEPERYVSHFNGSLVSVNLNDISSLQCENRKTYVVTGKDRLRIQAHLDLEEETLPGNQFSRINQGCIVNLRQIRYICGEMICMKNGDYLYPSIRRKKLFLERYQQYIPELDNETAALASEAAEPVATDCRL